MFRRPSACALGLIILQLTSGSAARAQEQAHNAYFRRIINQDHGLRETRVNAIAQTPDGYVWLGTRRGLLRYDGLTFTPLDGRNAHRLPAPWVNGLNADSKCRLWISTEHGVAVMEAGVIRRIESRYVPDADTWEVMEDARGRIWVTGAKGTHVGDGTVFHPVPGAEKLGYALWTDRRGRVWIGGRGFLALARNERVDSVERSALGERSVYDIVGDGAEGFWAATRDGAAHLTIDRNGAAHLDQDIGTAAKSRNPVWALARTPDGRVWMATDGRGVLAWNGSTLSTVDAGEGVAAPNVHALDVDSRGRVWAGTGAGLEKYQRSAFQNYGTERGLPFESVWSVRGNGNQDVWAAANDGGVYRFDGNRFTTAVAPKAPGTGSISTWSSHDGGIFAAKNLRQLLAVTREGTRDLSARLKLPAADVYGIYEDPSHELWFSTDSGLYRSRGGRARPAYVEVGLTKDDAPQAIVRDSAGRMFFGRPGLTLVDSSGPHRFGASEGLTDPDVRSILPYGRDVWIGTADSGLFVLRDNRITRMAKFDRQLASEVLGMVVDDLGSLWIFSTFGLKQVPISDLEMVLAGKVRPLRIRSFDREDGLSTTEFIGDFQSQIYKDSEGQIWLPGYGGVVRLDPRMVAADTTPPNILLERVLVNGAEQSPAAALTLQPKVSRLELTFAATNALVPLRVRIQYRMDGVDTNWIEAGERRMVSYGPLTGGTYRFRVRAANQDERWSPTPAELSFKVRYQLHEYPWFIPLLVSSAVGLVVVLNWVRRRRLEARGRELEALVNDRTADLLDARETLELRVDERTAQLASELTERKLLEQQLVQAQKLEGLGRLAGGVAHEINNSMTGVLGYAQLAELATTNAPVVIDHLQQLRVAGERVGRITRQLLAFARMHQTTHHSTNLGALLGRTGDSMRLLAGDRIQVDMNIPQGVRPAGIDETQLEQVLINLVLNAREAMPTGGRIEIRAENVERVASLVVGTATLSPGEYVRVQVSDTGTGMSEEVRARIFEPFYTTKGLERGGGLGLAVCHGIVTNIGGAIEARSAPGHGTSIELWLPVGSLSVATHTSNTGGTPPRGSETVMVVDDDPMVRTVAVGSLASLGYQIVQAVDGVDALDAMAKGARRVDLVLTDVMMPKMGGLELARTLRERGATVPILFMSGYAGGDAGTDQELAAYGPLLDKPFALDGLARAVRDALDGTGVEGAGAGPSLT